MLVEIFYLLMLSEFLNGAELNKISNQMLFSSVCQSGIREDNTNYIYCARRSLVEIPTFSKNNVVYDELVLSDNRITELSSESFARLKVKKIFLNGNAVRRIDAQTFSKLENHLEELWLEADQTSSLPLPKTILTHLRNLNTLHLKGFVNKLIENKQFQKLNRLEVLSLQFSSIETIDKFAFDNLNSLRELNLDGNLLESIPSECLTLKNLKVLSMSQNLIKKIDSDWFKKSSLPNLLKIDLSYNGLKQIESNSFDSLNKTLETLLLQNNELNSFNLKFLQGLNNLKELNLDFNIITQIPSLTFKNSNKIQQLSLQGNSVQFEAETSFDGLINVQKLNLARNGIKHLPDKIFGRLASLKSLSLDKNQISNLNYFTFDGVHSHLVNLSLQNAKLKTDDLQSLRILEKIERVKLGWNEIVHFDLNIFEKSSNSLLNLDAQNNQIKAVLNSAANSTFNNLNELDLSNNKLCHFDAKLLKNAPRLKSLGLNQNPLYCDCALLPLHEWTINKLNKDYLAFVQWQCEETAVKKMKRRFTSLKPTDFICDENSAVKCPTSLTSLKTSTIETMTTTTILTMPRISNMALSSESGVVFVNWDLDLNVAPNSDIDGFKITFQESEKIDPSNSPGFLIDKTQRSFKIDNLKPSTRYTICVSIIRRHGYDKYCREIDVAVNENELTTDVNKSTRKLKLGLIQPSQSVMVDSDQKSLLSSLMLTVLIILASFTFGLGVFMYFYIRKCKQTQKKIIKAKSGSVKTYTGAVLTSNAPPINDCNCSDSLQFTKKIDNMNNANPCSCVNMNAFTIGDTSTVSSTLSSVNNTQLNHHKSVNLNGVSCCLKEHHYEGEDMLQNNLETFKRVRKFEANNEPTTNSFSHFILHPQQQQLNNQNQQQQYLPYELYNCFQNGSLIVAPIHVKKATNLNSLNPNEHVYCEIPATMGRSRNSCQLVFNTNTNDTQLLMHNNNSNQVVWKNNNSSTLNHHFNQHLLPNFNQNSSTSLLHSSNNTTTSSSWSSNSSSTTSPQPNQLNPQTTTTTTSFNNNINKFNNASII